MAPGHTSTCPLQHVGNSCAPIVTTEKLPKTSARRPRRSKQSELPCFQRNQFTFYKPAPRLKSQYLRKKHERPPVSVAAIRPDDIITTEKALGQILRLRLRILPHCAPKFRLCTSHSRYSLDTLGQKIDQVLPKRRTMAVSSRYTPTRMA